jgi:hypothetical protein
VSVENATVTLESQSRSMGSDTELEGRIEALPELTAADDLVVAGRTVLTDEDTTVYFGNTEGDFEDLLIGFRVHVKGTMAGPDLLATVIMVQNTDPDIQYPINGIIEAFMGTEDAFEFTIGRHLIKGDAVGGAFQIEGALGGLQGACPAVSFGANGYQIVADAATVYDPAAPGCEGLKPGNKVLVDGIVQADGSVLATTIRK